MSTFISAVCGDAHVLAWLPVCLPVSHFSCPFCQVSLGRLSPGLALGSSTHPSRSVFEPRRNRVSQRRAVECLRGGSETHPCHRCQRFLRMGGDRTRLLQLLECQRGGARHTRRSIRLGGDRTRLLQPPDNWRGGSRHIRHRLHLGVDKTRHLQPLDPRRVGVRHVPPSSPQGQESSIFLAYGVVSVPALLLK